MSAQMQGMSVALMPSTGHADASFSIYSITIQWQAAEASPVLMNQSEPHPCVSTADLQAHSTAVLGPA